MSVDDRHSPSECGVNLLPLHTKAIYSDSEVAVIDAATGRVVFHVQTHLVILYAASGYFRTLMAGQFDVGDNSQFSVRIDFSQLEPSLAENVVRLFFRLFYVTIYDERQLSSEEMRLIDEHLLYLYQLASWYDCDALRLYCERRLFGAFSLDCFKLFSDYALTENPTGDGRFCILDERLRLFARFLQWYQCCTDEKKEEDEEETTPTATTLNEDYFLCNKRRIMNALLSDVENITRCRIPRRTITATSQAERQIDYYRRICHHCLTTTTTTTTRSLGCLERRYFNGKEVYAFRLGRDETLSRRFRVQLTLERTLTGTAERVGLKRSRSDATMEVESPDWLPAAATETVYRCHSEMVLLSKRQVLDRVVTQLTQSVETEQARTIGVFERHSVDDCYQGRCDSCRRPGRSIYVLILCLRVEFDHQPGPSTTNPEMTEMR